MGRLVGRRAGGGKELRRAAAAYRRGLQLDLPGVTGGGFLDFTGGPNDRYGGLLRYRRDEDGVSVAGSPPSASTS